MRYEMIITDRDLKTRFKGERDLVTYAPYHIGDRVVRCRNSLSVIKTEFIDAQCPLCGHAPFTPAPIQTEQFVIRQSKSGGMALTPAMSPVRGTVRHNGNAEHREQRSLPCFLLLLILSAVVALVPFAVAFFIPEAGEFIYEATCEIGLGYAAAIAGVISLITVLLIYSNDNNRRKWCDAEGGGALVLLPVSTPYMVLAAIWIVISLLATLLVIAGIIFALGILACVFS